MHYQCVYINFMFRLVGGIGYLGKPGGGLFL